eukprot:15925-Heterococcus_DN1.PRE.2
MELHYRLLLRELTQPSQWFSSLSPSTGLQAQPFGSSHLVQHVRCFGTVVSLSLNMDEPVEAVIDDTTGTVHVKLGSCIDVTGTVSLMPNTELKALQLDATSLHVQHDSNVLLVRLLECIQLYRTCYLNSGWTASECCHIADHQSSCMLNTGSAEFYQQQHLHDNALHAPESVDDSTVNAAVLSHNNDVQRNSTETLQLKVETVPAEVVHIPLGTQLYSIISAATSGISISTMLQELTTVHTEAAVQDALVELQLDVTAAAAAVRVV